MDKRASAVCQGVAPCVLCRQHCWQAEVIQAGCRRRSGLVSGFPNINLPGRSYLEQLSLKLETGQAAADVLRQISVKQERGRCSKS